MSTRNRSSVEHVIILMLENRSDDHMLGYLANGLGLAGDEFNLVLWRHSSEHYLAASLADAEPLQAIREILRRSGEGGPGCLLLHRASLPQLS